MTHHQYRCINKLLYEARVARNETRKEAAEALGISTLKLILIEKGYLNVSFKYQPAFIVHYDLKDDFFLTHSTYSYPIDETYINYNRRKKLRRVVASKGFRIYAAISIFTSVCCIAFGLYAVNRKYVSPRIMWTQQFTEFYQRMKEVGEKKTSILDFDTIYTVSEQTKEEGSTEDVITTTSITTYEKEINSESTNFDASIETKYKDTGKTKELYNFYLFSLNKHKVVYCTYSGYATEIEKAITVPEATAFIDDDREFKLNAFSYLRGGQTFIAEKGTDIHKTFENRFADKIPIAYAKIDEILKKNKLAYSNYAPLLEDIRKISRDYTLFSRLGIGFVISFSLTGALAITGLLLSIHYSRELEPKPRFVKEVKYVSIIRRDIPIRGIFNDIKYPSFIPEFVLKVVGLVVLALFGTTLFASVYLLFNADFIGFRDATAVKALTSNFLSSATLVLFFIKIDVYMRKSGKELLTNIIALFIGGLIFYIAEVLLVTTIMNDGNIVSGLLTALGDIIPGNVIWNLMLYSLIFFFLFTLPKKYENRPASILHWRLCSLIPTLWLLFALVYKLFIEDMIPDHSFYFSFLFHTQGIIVTLFAIFYIYSLYFMHLRNKLTFGEENAEVFSYSRTFALQKNILACIYIIILFLIDIFFKYKVPNNTLKLGKNWTIIFLVPFILLYRPHIGGRNKTWDTTYITLYGVCLTGGYIASALFILTKLDLGELFVLLF